MTSEELPEWLGGWCARHLGHEPESVLFQQRSISAVFGLRLTDGRDVVVKAREDDGRTAACVAVQVRLARRGFPCPLPITPVSAVGELGVHAEEFRPGGEMLRGDSPEIAVRYAKVFARLMAELAELWELAGLVELAEPSEAPFVPFAPFGPFGPPLPNPRWARWDHTDPGLWPSIAVLDERDQSAVPAYVVETAERARACLLAADLPCVLGHADFEAQNLRWRDGEVWAVHDWDSLAWQPEAALVGAACGTFSTVSPPTLAPVESSAAFLTAYQEFRGRTFTARERKVAWAASLWPALHNARWEALFGDAPVCGDEVREQGPERLRRANA
ncbi:hypothetical protein ACIRU8_45640 [Streptomyces sp. NPDC101175]|uniref:hypothetical protein n=1 Tax=Streptomyces sp. NPDC101175 TaxID=3366123 RepID=UPI0038378F37